MNRMSDNWPFAGPFRGLLAVWKIRGLRLTQPERSAPLENGRARFLEAADRIFLAEGYKGATIRAITKSSKSSLATLSRHWSGKRELFAEVFARHFDPIHREQNALLDQVELAAKESGETPSALAILNAFYGPAIGNDSTQPQSLGRRVYCRALVEPSSEARHIIAELISDVRSRVIDLLRQALPSLDEEEFFLAINMVMGAYVFLQVFGHQLATAMGSGYSTLNDHASAERLAEFVARGLTKS
jgi:AcrR family transcriptional regulator